jgi:hypothetical protein
MPAILGLSFPKALAEVFAELSFLNFDIFGGFDLGCDIKSDLRTRFWSLMALPLFGYAVLRLIGMAERAAITAYNQAEETESSEIRSSRSLQHSLARSVGRHLAKSDASGRSLLHQEGALTDGGAAAIDDRKKDSDRLVQRALIMVFLLCETLPPPPHTTRFSSALCDSLVYVASSGFALTSVRTRKPHAQTRRLTTGSSGCLSAGT